MTTVFRVVTLAVLLAMATGCARYAVTDYDSNAGFDRYSSYRFAERDENAIQGLDAARIERASGTGTDRRRLHPGGCGAGRARALPD